VKILLAGPKICTPWSEGRKRFVRDLAAELARDHQVAVVTTVQRGESTAFAAPSHAPVAATGAGHLFRYHIALADALTNWQPDLVCHVPIGSFHGKYRYGNLASLWLAERQCAWHATPCYTLMYAIVREASVAKLGGWVSHLLVNQFTEGATQIRFGATLPENPVVPRPGDGRSLLFMAGMAERTLERLDHVLHLRGLATLLQAGAELASVGFSLTIAVPLLADAGLRAALLDSPDTTWPAERLRILDLVSVPEVYDGHDFFIFPYGRDEVQFVPNSVLEAMHFGIPTVLPRQPFLMPLIGEGATAYSYLPGDAEDLARVLRTAADDANGRAAVCRAAAALVRGKFDITCTCQDLLACHQARTVQSN
jgi:glycosyltransferase involved in cell wall biosynthesis